MNEDAPLQSIDRTYAIDVWGLTAAQRTALEAVYRSLPGFAGYPLPSQCPVWFGPVPEDENIPSIPYLWASVEPSGLQVAGYLSAAVWEVWEAQFLQDASAALGFPVRDADE
jgi:hypothetical protein